jgi:hypothetical protein
VSFAFALACFVLTSCGTTCVAGIFANGTGTVVVKNSPSPPACPFSTGMGTMNVAAAKLQICERCPASSQAQHIFVTLKSVQLHSVFSSSTDNPEWLELAPNLSRDPLQIDLLSDAGPEILVASARIPAGTYRELVLQFLSDSPAPDGLSIANPCGKISRNCMFLANGGIEELYFMGDGASPRLRLPLQHNGSSALAVVPGETVDLRLKLEPQQAPVVSPSEGWQIRYVLLGNASVSK